VPRRREGLGRAAVEAALLLAVAAPLAFGLNAFREEPVPLVADPRLFQLEVDLPVLSTRQTVAAFDAGGSVFLDARGADAFREGHIGGAFSVPADAFLDRYAAIAPLLSGEVAVVVYGAAGGLSDVEKLAKALVSAGVARTSLFLDGYEGWVAAGAPMGAGDDPTASDAGGETMGDDDAPPEAAP
jgi:rhodanese-related sulfurtransferase